MISKKIIFANGTFDVLHGGHFNFLMHCYHLKKVYDYYFIIAVDSDKKIRKDKGWKRPIFSFEDRVKSLSSLVVKEKVQNQRGYVDVPIIDFVTDPFDTNDELADMIKHLSPQIMVKGEEWEGDVVGQEFCKSVYFYPTSKYPYSSTKIIETIEDKAL